MVCPHCEFEIEDDLEICPYCQMFVNEVKTSDKEEQIKVIEEQGVGSEESLGYDDFYDRPMVVSAAKKMSCKEFMKLPELKAYRSYILWGSVIMYLCALCTALLSIVFLHNLLGVLDAIVVLALTISIQITKNKICAVVLCIYSMVNSLAGFFMKGSPSGLAVLIASVYILLAVFQVQKAWKKYEKTGEMPSNQENLGFRKWMVK